MSKLKKHWAEHLESKQSSPIGVEQAAKEYANRGSKNNYDYYGIADYRLYNAFIAGSQWGWVKASERLPDVVGDYFIRESDQYGGWHRFHVHWDGEYFKLIGKHFESPTIEWLDETPAHPTAVNGDDLLEWCDMCDGCGWYEGGTALKTYCQQCNGAGKIPKGSINMNQPIPPKAAALKAEVKSKEDCLRKAFERHKKEVLPDNWWCDWETCEKDGTAAMVYEAMEEYANQFKNQKP